MDVIEAHARRLPPVDDRWVPRTFERGDLEGGLLAGKVAGWAIHPLDNVRNNLRLLLEGDPDKLFGLSGIAGSIAFDEALRLVAKEAGAPIDPDARSGGVWIEPAPIVDACEAMGDRLAAAGDRGERVVVATGHPTGLALLYLELARLLHANGATILKPADGVEWRDERTNAVRRIRYLDGVAMLTGEDAPIHTHWPEAMRRILDDARPDLVIADHGFAGAAIEAGIETMSVADVNDPALIVAKAQGRTEIVVVMDDHVDPDAYWPCFQAVASRFDGGPA
jgi:hypothetical protein